MSISRGEQSYRCLLVKAVQNLELIIGFSNLSITNMPTMFFGYTHSCWIVVRISQRVSGRVPHVTLETSSRSRRNAKCPPSGSRPPRLCPHV